MNAMLFLAPAACAAGTTCIAEFQGEGGRVSGQSQSFPCALAFHLFIVKISMSAGPAAISSEQLTVSSSTDLRVSRGQCGGWSEPLLLVLFLQAP